MLNQKKVSLISNSLRKYPQNHLDKKRIYIYIYDKGNIMVINNHRKINGPLPAYQRQ